MRFENLYFSPSFCNAKSRWAVKPNDSALCKSRRAVKCPTTGHYCTKLLSECQAVAELQMRLTSLFNCQSARASEFFTLSQIVHCQSADITIAEFSRLVFITVFTPFLQDLCFISHEEDNKGPIFGGCFLSARRCDDKIPPQKTSSQSSRPSRGTGFTTGRGGIDQIFLLINQPKAGEQKLTSLRLSKNPCRLFRQTLAVCCAHNLSPVGGQIPHL